jgi:gliding motility-associated-like protein
MLVIFTSSFVNISHETIEVPTVNDIPNELSNRITNRLSISGPTIECPDDIVVSADPGLCGAYVRFDDASATDDSFNTDIIVMNFEGPNVFDTPYIEKGMRLDGNDFSHIDAPWPIPCGNRDGALIHASTGNTWTYNGGEPFTPISVFVCTTNMKFTTGECGTEFVPDETGIVKFPDTPEWQNITSMVWEETGGAVDTSIDDFKFRPEMVRQTAGLESGCFFPVGTTEVTYTAIDDEGNSTSCSFNVTVQDREKPFIACQNIIVGLNDTFTATIDAAQLLQETPTDNCGIETVSVDRTAFGCNDIGENEVQVTVVDIHGNETICTSIVTVTSGTAVAHLEKPEDVTACSSYSLPIIQGTDLSGNQAYYSQPDGNGTKWVEGTVITEDDFTDSTQTVYIFDSSASAECFAQEQFQITFVKAPILEQPNDIFDCETYTFPTIAGTNLSGEEAYYTGSNGTGTKYMAGDEITDDGNTTYPITIYIFDQKSSDAACSDQVEVQLDLTRCEMNVNIDASTTVICDLNPQSVELTAIVDPENPKGNRSYIWKNTDTGEIVGDTQQIEVFPNTTTIYEVTVKDDGRIRSLNTANASIEIEIKESPLALQPEPVKLCNETHDSSNEPLIDLTTYNSTVKPQASTAAVTYYRNATDAIEGINALPAAINIQDGVNDFYVRIEDQETGCFDNTILTLILNQQPQFDINPTYTLCVDPAGNVNAPLFIDTGLEASGYDIKWFYNDGTIETELNGESLAALPVTRLGEYRVLVTDRNTGCTMQSTTVVQQASTPVQFRATSDNSTEFNNHTVTAYIDVSYQENEIYQVRIDGGEWINTRYSSNGYAHTFERVPTLDGMHLVEFRSATGCWWDSEQVRTIGIPKYFTPNADGYHDTWNIKGTADLDASTRINVFDRYGKLLGQFGIHEAGWDGTYNGNPLPSTDYWFSVEFAEGDLIKGHFSMKR